MANAAVSGRLGLLDKGAVTADVELLQINAPTAQTMEREPFRPRPMFETQAEAEKWGDEWWAGYAGKVAAHDGEIYIRPSSLFEQLEGENPPVKLLRGSWLLKRAQQLKAAWGNEARHALALPRRQELEANHPEAFIGFKEMSKLPIGVDGGSYEGGQLRLIALSHGWLTPQHPDPKGQTLRRFAEYVRRERLVCPCGAPGFWGRARGAADTCHAGLIYCFPCLDAATRKKINTAIRKEVDCGPCCNLLVASGCCLVTCCPCFIGVTHGCVCCCIPIKDQPCCTTQKQFPAGEFAVFYDFCSLHQKDERGERTPEEAAAFGRALSSMGSWYAHSCTTTYVMRELPPGWAGATPYDQRGWTTFESSVSGLNKNTGSFGAGWRPLVDPQIPRLVATGYGDGGTNQVRGYRPPPRHPRAFAATLAQKAFTNGKSDCELVAGLYADTLAGALGNATELDFDNCEWRDDDLEALAEALPLAKKLRELNLRGNPRIGARGWQALAAAISAGAAPRLRWVHVTDPRSSAVAGLLPACEARGIEVSSGLVFMR